MTSNRFYTVGISVFLCLAFLHLLSLNYPLLNGDEALGGVIAGIEIKRILSGHLPNFTPIVDYAGPIDIWAIMLIRILTSWIPNFTPQAWEVRLGTFLFFIVSSLSLAKELKFKDQRLAAIYLILIATHPIGWIHAKVSWSSSYILGTFSFLLAEVFRSRRTQEVRWARIGFFAGLSLEFHPTAAIGLVGILAMNFQIFWNSLKTNRKGLGLGIFLFFLLITPELVHFPPPVGGAGEHGNSISNEFSYLLGVIIGRRSMMMRYSLDFLPILLGGIYFIIFGYFLISHWRNLSQSHKKSEDKQLIQDTVVTVLMTSILFYSCYQHRTLSILGHERYLHVIVPVCTYLLSVAIFRFYSSQTRKRNITLAFLIIFFITGQIRIALAVFDSMKSPDPYLAATKWLEKECPKAQCVAYAENFWDYWPIQYYSNQTIDLNIDPTQVYTMPPQHRWTPFDIKGREIAGCWFPSSPPRYSGPFKKKVDIPGQGNFSGQTCYFGINPALR